tara:strand:- start:1235 stop:1408 length:174 start_codon:yes stop_codon:yes gene_type:complete
MQPWENENFRRARPKRNLRKKIKIAADGITLGIAVCSAIYISLLYEASKTIIRKTVN